MLSAKVFLFLVPPKSRTFISIFILSFLFIFPPCNYLSFQHSFLTQNKNPPLFFKTKSQNLSTNFQPQQTFQNKKNILFYLKLPISKQISKPLAPPTLFKTNNTLFTSDFLFFLFPFFQYSSDAVVTNNEIY